MSDMKCPQCGGRLVYWGATGALLKCSQCNFGWGNEELWQALTDSMKEYDLCHDALVERTKEVDRTRKALYAAVGLLKIMNDGLPNGNRWKWEIEKALERITALTKGGDNDKQ